MNEYWNVLRNEVEKLRAVKGILCLYTIHLRVLVARFSSPIIPSLYLGTLRTSYSDYDEPDFVGRWRSQRCFGLGGGGGGFFRFGGLVIHLTRQHRPLRGAIKVSSARLTFLLLPSRRGNQTTAKS